MADKQQLILEKSMLKQRVHELEQLNHKTYQNWTGIKS
jgi:hypothetical protein